MRCYTCLCIWILHLANWYWDHRQELLGSCWIIELLYLLNPHKKVCCVFSTDLECNLFGAVQKGWFSLLHLHTTPLIVGSTVESRVLHTDLVSTNDLMGIHLALENCWCSHCCLFQQWRDTYSSDFWLRLYSPVNQQYVKLWLYDSPIVSPSKSDSQDDFPYRCEFQLSQTHN